MNIFEMHIGVRLKVDAIESNKTRDFSSEEIDWYINNAIIQYVKSQYSMLKMEKRDIDSQSVLENLRTIINTQELESAAPPDYIPRGLSGTLPADYFFHVTSKTINQGKFVINRLIGPAMLSDYIETKDNSPVFKEYPIYIENNKSTVIFDALSNAVGKIQMTYIKIPRTVKLMFNNGLYDPETSINCDLPIHTHEEIIELSVQNMLKDSGRLK